MTRPQHEDGYRLADGSFEQAKLSASDRQWLYRSAEQAEAEGVPDKWLAEQQRFAFEHWRREGTFSTLDIDGAAWISLRLAECRRQGTYQPAAHIQPLWWSGWFSALLMLFIGLLGGRSVWPVAIVTATWAVWHHEVAWRAMGRRGSGATFVVVASIVAVVLGLSLAEAAANFWRLGTYVAVLGLCFTLAAVHAIFWLAPTPAMKMRQLQRYLMEFHHLPRATAADEIAARRDDVEAAFASGQTLQRVAGLFPSLQPRKTRRTMIVGGVIVAVAMVAVVTLIM